MLVAGGPSVELIGHVRALRVLCEVAAQGSFSAAAEALGLTQSAVSQHVAGLERQTGLPLVERGTRPVALTDAGHALVRHGRAVSARLESAEQELAEIAGRRGRRLRFGSFPTALTTFVPAALARLRSRQPATALTVVDDHLQGLLPRLSDGELDLAVIYDNEVLGGSRFGGGRVHLFDDTFQAVLPRGHRVAAGDRTVELTDLAEEAWVGGRPGSAWFTIVRHSCRAVGFDPRVSLTSDDYRAVLAFVAAGLGVAVIPGLAVARPPAGVEVRQLRAGAPMRRISVAYPDSAYQPPVVAEMITILEGVTQRLRAARRPA
ncbi:LysR family transcriptional regulator [Actinoplanes sp. NPDC051861]|uniref:LysR family transcriptional regulator n=1 Tax=Actinoplanes sp. NPDC051861 TaxID=3155170 RepID=UPI00344AB98F